MAQEGNQDDWLRICCSICLDLLKDPVTIPCGHNYCMSCIKTYWDKERRVQSCPQCRETFTARPVLVKNTMLAELVEELKKTGLQAAPADHCYAGPEDVACDVCTGRKLKAVKSCLVCLVSYCEKHLRPHYEAPAFNKHKLVDASIKLQETICSLHDEVMKIFCRTDQQCICYLCFVDEHKGHDTVSAAAERTEKQRELEQNRKKIQQRIKDREKDVKLLQQEVETINRSANRAVKDNKKIFRDLIFLIEKRISAMKQQIRSQQKTEVSRVKELQKKLEQEITELRREDAELQQLSSTETHVQFLHNYTSMSGVGESTGFSKNQINSLFYFEKVVAAVTVMRDKVQDVLSEKWPQAEPKTRADFIKYSCPIALDANTANTFLVLSEQNRKVTCQRDNKPYPYHPDRFVHIAQVLSKDGLTGRCYWEVKRSRNVAIAVAYKSICRSGDLNAYVFGYNEKSWVLHYNNYCTGYTFGHNHTSESITAPPSSIIGVYLDHSAGILSFYSVSTTMTLLHRVQTTFTEPLHVGLCLAFHGDSAELCELK